MELGAPGARCAGKGHTCGNSPERGMELDSPGPGLPGRRFLEPGGPAGHAKG